MKFNPFNLEISILAIILVVALDAQCQKAFPEFSDQPTWTIWGSSPTFPPPNTWNSAYHFFSETVMCGRVYSKGYFGAFFRSDSIKSYYRLSPNCNEKEYVMYDYSLQSGDSSYVHLVDTSCFWADSLLVRIVSVDTVSYMGIPRLTLDVEFSDGFQFYNSAKWIKGIGEGSCRTC